MLNVRACTVFLSILIVLGFAKLGHAQGFPPAGVQVAIYGNGVQLCSMVGQGTVSCQGAVTGISGHTSASQRPNYIQIGGNVAGSLKATGGLGG
jgi:hypothetical protein